MPHQRRRTHIQSVEPAVSLPKAAKAGQKVITMAGVAYREID